MGLSKLINKVNKAKSAINSLKGISSKINSLNYDSVTDQLGEEAEAAKSLLQKSRQRDTTTFSQSEKHRRALKQTPSNKFTELIYPHGDLLENNIVFNIKPRRKGTTPEWLKGTATDTTNLMSEEEVDIVLYVPDGITSETSVQYDGQETGLGARQMNKIMEDVSGAAKGNKFQAGLDAIKQGGGAMIQNQVISILNGLSGNIKNLKEGRAVNPMHEAQFQGIGFRSFTFDYEFYPKNELEAETVNQIIYTFRTAMLPDTYGASFGDEEMDAAAKEFHGGKAPENFFNYPNVFKVSFDGPIASKVDGFLPMVLEDCSVDHFNGNKIAYFANGQPVSSSMSLKFKEIKLLTQESYQRISAYGKDIGGMDSVNPEANV